jgi:monovalent cation:proton antiporter-2 (CPA2) family protein
LFIRFKLGAVLGYLATGILIGPAVLGLVGNAEQTLQFAEFGIVLLLFVIGLELQPSRLWALRRDIFGLGLAQVLLCGLGLTGLLLALTSFTWEAALVVGLPLGLSSTALVMQLLNERQMAATPFGERSFAMLLFQDLAIVPMLTIVGALSRAARADPVPGWQTALITAGALVFLVLVGRYALPRLFRIIGSLGAREAFVAAALLCVMGSALLMASLGLSMALGAFVAGVMLAESPYRHALEADIEPFRGLMLGLFFIAIGMSLDLNIVAANWALVLALVVGVMAVKTTVIAVLARSFGTEWPRAFKMGLLLAQGGEFGFVLFAEAERGLLISHSAAQLFGAVVTCSMALTPLLFRLAGRMIAGKDDPGSRDGPESAGTAGHGGHVVLVGSGRVGQVIAQMLRARGQAITAIDLDAELIDITDEACRDRRAGCVNATTNRSGCRERGNRIGKCRTCGPVDIERDRLIARNERNMVPLGVGEGGSRIAARCSTRGVCDLYVRGSGGESELEAARSVAAGIKHAIRTGSSRLDPHRHGR